MSGHGRRRISGVNSDINAAREHLFAGEFQAAHAAAQSALRVDGRSFEAVLVMAAIAVEHGNAPGAARLCAMLREAGHESCWLEVLDARVALLKQDQVAARTHALAAAALGTEDPHIANQLGVALSRTGWHDRAVGPFRTAVAGSPGNADYRYNLAVALQFAGELAEAEQNFAALVELDPGHAKGWLSLVQLADTPGDDWDERLAHEFEQAGEPESRLALGHALAALAEKRERWDASLKWLDRAKAAKGQEVAHDREAVEALVDAAIAAAEEMSIDLLPAEDERAIFITGMPRSGTTLVERILSSHPTVTSLGELSDFAIVLKRHLKTPGPLVLDAQLLVAATGAASLDPVGREYISRVEHLARGAPRFIDKMPFNVFLAPAILSAVPGARVICLRRSPFDVLFANYRQLFATGFSYYSYAYDFADTAHFVAQFERMADAFAKLLPEGRFHAVRYEDVVTDQRRETERLLEFCGLDWDEACIRFHENDQPVATASSVQVRSPIYTSSLAKWRRYSEGSERAIAELGRYGIAP